jgi:group II intron reverse transcriptase/maturase
MCKSRKQQKNEGVQLEIFSKRMGSPAGPADAGSGLRSATGVELDSRLRDQQRRTIQLIDAIADPANLAKAYQQVARNAGGPGVDGETVEELATRLSAELPNIGSQLREQKWNVAPVKKVLIPKASGGKRMLGVPTVRDRMVQQAIHQKLSPIYEPYFSPYSYGFRPGRNAQQAIRQAAEYVREGYSWVVDMDLEKFFDKINHDRLMSRLAKAITDKRLLRLIDQYLKAGMMHDGLMEQRVAGTPQGGPLSPLLSNIILDELDWELSRRGLRFCRYADDCNIFVGSRKAAKRVMESVNEFIEGTLKLKVNRNKTGVRRCEEVTFLGYTIQREGRIRAADKSIRRLKAKLRILTQRNRGVAFSELIRQINAVIRGWTNYFRLATCWLSSIRELDGWLRRKLRCYRLKQCGRVYTVYKLLRTLGIKKQRSWNVVIYSQGWWHMSNRMAVTQAMNLSWFDRQGLESLYRRMNPP